MARYVVKLPDIGEGMTEAEIVAWHVKPGDVIREEDPLVDVMTEKATVEIPSPVSGTVVGLGGAVGDKRPVGSELATLEVAEAASGGPASPAVREEAAAALGAQTVAPALRAADHPPVARPLASPAVRKRAAERGVDLRLVAGTGPGGRVTQPDLDAYGAAPAKPAPPRAAARSRTSRSSGCAARSPSGCRRRPAASRISPISRKSTSPRSKSCAGS